MKLHWYAIYTKHNTEQILQASILHYSQQNALSYETYLPLKEEVKKWRDRIKVKKLPLFKNYLFVKHDDNGFFKIKNMKGFCDYIRFGSKPSAIPSEQMETIQKVAQQQVVGYSQANALMKGRKVRISRGALAGIEGVLLDERSNSNVMIEVKSLKLCMNISIPANDVVLI